LVPGQEPEIVKTTLVAIRHGETESNRIIRFQGQRDVPLNDTGRQQAAAVSQALCGLQPAAIYSSDLSRAYDTALAISRACNTDVIIDKRLRERAFGHFEGLTKPEVAALFPQQYASLEARELHFKPIGGESIQELYERVVGVMRELAGRHTGQLFVVVTHLWVLDSLYRCAENIALEAEPRARVPNAALCRLACHEGKFNVEEWAKVSHLSPEQENPVNEVR
jgi:2,3-bisphosphoglycerate-dependent phosphoglycerate mutase